MWNTIRPRRATRWFLLPVLVTGVSCAGCLQRRSSPPGTTTPGTTAIGITATGITATEAIVTQAEPPQDTVVKPAIDEPQDNRPKPTEPWTDLLEQTTQCLQREALDEARQNLTRLENLGIELTAEQIERLAAVRAELERRLGERRLRAEVQRLNSSKREDVQAAQERLFEKADAALPLLREVAGGEDPVLVRNTLEMLRLLRQPEVTLPIMVEVLRRGEQQASWPDAVREIELAGAPGAGRPLLELALSSELPEQRMAALNALAKVVDPPRETLTALLPWILRDGPELAAALSAARHAVATHGQHDLPSGRGLGVQLSSEQFEQLGALPARLSQIMAADAADPPGEAAQAAKVLSIAIRQLPAEPLPGVKVLAFGAEMEPSRAAAVLDGQWNTTDTKLMWRHAVKQPGSIVFDLGGPRTVTGVRIWNLNE